MEAGIKGLVLKNDLQTDLWNVRNPTGDFNEAQSALYKHSPLHLNVMLSYCRSALGFVILLLILIRVDLAWHTNLEQC